jgi:hypothetical protein
VIIWSHYLDINEMKQIYADNYDDQVSDYILGEAVAEFNGRLDNYADELLNDIIDNIKEDILDNVSYEQKDIDVMQASISLAKHYIRHFQMMN